MNRNPWLMFFSVIVMYSAILTQSATGSSIRASAMFEDDGPALSTSQSSDDKPLQKDSPENDAAGVTATDSDKPANTEKTDDASTDDPANEQSQAKLAPPPKIKHKLTQSQAALRDQVRQMLSVFQKQPFNTRQNTPADIMDFCLPYGCATEITLFDASGERRANGITCLCWNFPSGEIEPLTLIDGHIAARLGYGVQSQPSQFLATLAFARVQANYPLRAEKTVRTVADLVESEKLSCRTGADMSLKLIGLSYYAEEETWNNDLGEEWSLEKILQEELNRPVPTAADSGLNRLLGLAYANYHREKRDIPLEGQFARAEKYLKDFHKYAFNMQNADGSWGYFLSARGSTKDTASDLRSTAYVLEWLVLSLPEDNLGDARVAAAVNWVVQGLNTQRNRGSAPTLPSREINSIARALHALAIYDDRFCKTADEDKPVADKPKAATAAPQKSSNAPYSR